MKDINETSYRELLLKATANKWFWPSYTASTILTVLFPIMKGWGNFDTFSSIGLVVAMFVLCVILASGSQLHKYNIGTALVFTLLTWFNSSPTEGLGTYFYTEAQIERFKRVEEVRSIARQAAEWRLLRKAKTWEQAEIEAGQPNVQNGFVEAR
ncbi:hypothetical protein ACE02P_17795 [Shewanella bicestrii]